MKRLPLAVLALVVGAAACQEFSTSPNSEAAVRAARFSNPPPPPIDTGAAGSFVPTSSDLSTRSSLSPRFTIVGGSPNRVRADIQTSSFFRIPVRYLFNRPDNSGYLHLGSDEANNVDASSNGMIKVRKGILSGKGTLKIQTVDGLLTIDVSSIQQPPSFVGCSAPVIGGGAAPQDSGGVCFNLFFSSATLDNGETTVQGSVQMDPFCPPDNNSCFLIG